MTVDPASRRDEPDPPPHDADEDSAAAATVAELRERLVSGLADDLLDYARAARSVAARFTPDDTRGVNPGQGQDALMWIRASREALAAHKLAGEIDTAERAAIARQLAALREQVAALTEQRAALLVLVNETVEGLERGAQWQGIAPRDALQSAGHLRRQLAAIVPESSPE